MFCSLPFLSTFASGSAPDQAEMPQLAVLTPKLCLTAIGVICNSTVDYRSVRCNEVVFVRVSQFVAGHFTDLQLSGL